MKRLLVVLALLAGFSAFSGIVWDGPSTAYANLIWDSAK